jgi:hypothetical protein
MARNQQGPLPVMSRKQERQTDHADSGRQGYECGWRLSFRPARSALRSWAVGCIGVRVPDLRLPSRSEAPIDDAASRFRRHSIVLRSAALFIEEA